MWCFRARACRWNCPKSCAICANEKKEQFRTKLVPIVSSARAASIIARKWMQKYDYIPDAFVVEGPKAGGHLGFAPENLTDPTTAWKSWFPRWSKPSNLWEDAKGIAVPVIAAGGVYSGEDIARFLDLGASGVQMGTRFVATYECDADDRFKEAYLKAKPEDVTIIKSPVGMPGRALFNKFIEAARRRLEKTFQMRISLRQNLRTGKDALLASPPR